MSTGQTFTHFAYIPDLGANILYICIFGFYLLIQVALGIKFRTWDYMGAMLCGGFLEVAGYTARIFMRKYPQERTPFLMDNICLILGPAFLAASIYLCMGRIVVVYGRRLSRLSPRSILIIFICCDLTNLILQGVGGAISSTSLHRDQIQTGINVIIAGLATQVTSLLMFICLGVEFGFRVRRESHDLAKGTCELRETRVWKAFLCGLALATLCTFTRSCFRIAELSQGFSGPLANDEITFMVLEGAMMIIATGNLTLLHPGLCFQGHWKAGKEPWPQDNGTVESVYPKDGNGVNITIETKEV